MGLPALTPSRWRDSPPPPLHPSSDSGLVGAIREESSFLCPLLEDMGGILLAPLAPRWLLGWLGDHSQLEWQLKWIESSEV